MSGILPSLVESNDYVAVYSASKCCVENCNNSAWSLYKRMIKDDQGQNKIAYVSFCNALEGHRPSEDDQFVSQTKMSERIPCPTCGCVR